MGAAWRWGQFPEHIVPQLCIGRTGSPFSSLCWAFSAPLPPGLVCFPKQAQRRVIKPWWGQGEQGKQVEMIIYSFTFSPLFQIDFQLGLQSTIYNRNQTWGGLIQIWIKQQLPILVVLTCCLLVDCEVLGKGPWNNCSKCECSVSWARSAALSVLLGLSERQKGCRFLSIFVIKKMFWLKWWVVLWICCVLKY